MAGCLPGSREGEGRAQEPLPAVPGAGNSSSRRPRPAGLWGLRGRTPLPQLQQGLLQGGPAAPTRGLRTRRQRSQPCKALQWFRLPNPVRMSLWSVRAGDKQGCHAGPTRPAAGRPHEAPCHQCRPACRGSEPLQSSCVSSVNTPTRAVQHGSALITGPFFHQPGAEAQHLHL